VGKKLRLWSSTRASMRGWRLVACDCAAQTLKGEVRGGGSRRQQRQQLSSRPSPHHQEQRRLAPALSLPPWPSLHIIHGGTGPVWWVNKPVFSFTEALADGIITHRVHTHTPTHRVRGVLMPANSQSEPNRNHAQPTSQRHIDWTAVIVIL
jgi:hypothetical protein